MAEHVVKDNEDIASIAAAHGFHWKTLWDDPANAALKDKRKDPNILKSGDVLVIPELRPRDESLPADQRHRFKARGLPVFLRLRIMEPPAPEAGPAQEDGSKEDEPVVEDPDYDPKAGEEKPLKNCPYVAEIDGKLINGSTDGDGKVKIPLPPKAKEGRLVFRAGTPQERVIPLDLGAMDPITEWTGLRKRLVNLGIPCKLEGEELTPDLEAALMRLQELNGLDITGRPDDKTRDKLKEIHGS